MRKLELVHKEVEGYLPVLQFIQARKPGLQAPSNLAGSKIKKHPFFPLINSFSEV